MLFYQPTFFFSYVASGERRGDRDRQFKISITDDDHDEIEEFYEDIEKVLMKMELDGATYIMGNFSAE